MTEPATQTPTKGFARICCECGAAFQAQRQEGLFCSTGCRRDFNNRRAMRGAELYDLFMVMRYDRLTAKAIGIWSIMCRMAELWRKEDQGKRAGRPSWQRPQAALRDKAYLKARAVVAGKRRP